MKKTADNLPDEIQTERLLLRAPIAKDAPQLQSLANNKALHKWLARLPHPYESEHAFDFINNLSRTQEDHAYSIINENDDFIGAIGLRLDREIGVELGFWLGEPYWGKGYGSEAAKAVVKIASDIGYKVIFARAISSNIGSIKVLKKAGFIIEGERIDDCGQHKGIVLTYLKYDLENFQK